MSFSVAVNTTPVLILIVLVNGTVIDTLLENFHIPYEGNCTMVRMSENATTENNNDLPIVKYDIPKMGKTCGKVRAC